MNGSPHYHELKVRTSYGSHGGALYVQYGDTKVRVGLFGFAHKLPWGYDRKLKRAITKAIRRHDEGSIRAGAREARKHKAHEQLVDINTALKAAAEEMAKQIDEQADRPFYGNYYVRDGAAIPDWPSSNGMLSSPKTVAAEKEE